MNFEGKLALVTGGTKGIGREICYQLRKLGCNVHYTGRTRQELDTRYGYQYIVNFENSEERSGFLYHHEQAGTKFDIIVNNMGINKYQEMDGLEAWWNFDEIMEINCSIPMLILSSNMVAPNAKIVNISSISGQFGLKGRSAYCASKHALNGITKTMAVEKPEMCVNTVSPGPIETELTDSMLSPEDKEEIVKRIPKGRFGTTKEVANLVLFLVSDLNTYITGQDFVIDGGLTATWWNH